MRDRAGKAAKSCGSVAAYEIHVDARSLGRLLERRPLLRARSHRPHPRDDLPQIVGGLDDPAKGRHGSHHDLALDALVTCFVKSTEPSAISLNSVSSSGTIDPRVVGERYAHAAAAAAAMAAIAAEREIFLVTLFGHRGDLVVVRVMQSAFGRGLDEVERGRGVARLAAFPAGGAGAGGCALCRRWAASGWRGRLCRSGWPAGAACGAGAAWRCRSGLWCWGGLLGRRIGRTWPSMRRLPC